MNRALNRLFETLLLVAISFKTITSLDTAVIQTGSGKVQGVVHPTAVPGKNIQWFSNIPYAEAPAGKLRFAKPEPKKPWNETLKYSNMSIACWQKGTSDQNFKMTEDCLVLNIWTPFPQKTNQSVMIWFHGGAFTYSSANDYLGYNFVAIGDVILVTINYRLSVLGFLTSGDDRVKGNFGLFDQRLAMKWVKENIASFGGDPESITIFGESAGGASVSAHTLSQKSWPYFKRAILQSGGMNMVWAISSKEATKAVLNKFLDSVNCTDNEKLLECLKNNVTEKDFEKIYITTPVDFGDTGLTPSVDGDFFTDHPSVLLQRGTIKNAAAMLGVTKDEGFLFCPAVLKQTRDVDDIKDEFEDVLIKSILLNSSKAVYNKARELYQPKCFPSFVEAIRPMVDIYSDAVFTCFAAGEAITRALYFPSTNLYMFRFSYASPIFGLRSLYPQGTFGFVAHAAEVSFVFGAQVNNPIYTSEDQIMSLRMILYWTNFAKYGDPNVGVTTLPMVIDGIDNLPNWPKFINSTRKYLDMESNSRMTVRTRMREEHCEFLTDPKTFVENEGTTPPPRAESTTLPPGTTTVRSPSVAVKHISQMALLVVFVQVVLLL